MCIPLSMEEFKIHNVPSLAVEETITIHRNEVQIKI